MSLIDKLGYSNQGSDSSPSFGAYARKQSWMKALEEAGLRNALQNAHRSSSVDVKSTFHPDSALGGTAPAIAKSLRLETPSVQRLLPSIRPVQPSSDFEKGQASVQTTRAIASQDRALVVAPISVLDRTVAAAIASDGASPGTETCLPLEMVFRQKWQPRKVTVLPNEHGVDVWIRDASLSGDGLRGLLEGAPEPGDWPGVSQVRVFLNGRFLHMSGIRSPES